MGKSPHTMPVRYEYEKGYTARFRYHQVWDRLDGALVSCHETYASALSKIKRLNEEWRMTYQPNLEDTGDMSSIKHRSAADALLHYRGALAAIVADVDCCAASKAIARDALREQGVA